MSKLPGKSLKKLRKMMAPAADEAANELQFGVLAASDLEDVLAGAPKDVPGLIRCYMARNGVMMSMSAAEARRIADHFDTPEARAVGLDDIPATLRDLATECDMRNAAPGGSA